MRVSIDNSFPGFNMLFLSSEITSIKELYDTLDKDKEEVILNTHNIKKITDFFNSTDKTNLLSKQMLEEYGLFEEAIPKEIVVIDYELCGNKYINSLKTIHCFEIIDENIIEFIKNSREKFYKLLKQSDEKKIISKYSLSYESCIAIDSITYNKEKSYISVQFSVNYILDMNDPEYFLFFKDKNCYFTLNVDPYNKIRVSMKTKYFKQG